MASNYTDQLGEWVRQNDSSPHATHLTAFMAARDDVRAALDEGYAIKTIWRNLRDAKRVDFGYHTLVNYVHRFLRQEPSKVLPRRAKQIGKPLQRGPAFSIPGDTSIPSFTFNPVARREDLL